MDIQRGIKEALAGIVPSPTELHLAVLLSFKQNRFRARNDFSMFSDIPLEGYKLLSEW